ncbi:ribokinase [Glaciibacter flavus]|uniref:ribokinase n=1 Tax=Orlajensenia flava TaxID=2565934 RepID=UPI003B00BF96
MNAIEAGVAIVGSINIDLVIEVRESPSAGETVLASGLSDAVGGKGFNQAKAAARDATTFLIGCVGDDSDGERARESARAHGIRTEFISEKATKTGRAFIQLAPSGENRIVVVPLANSYVSAELVRIALDRCRPRVVLTQLEIPLEAVRAAAHWAATNTARFVLNPSPMRDLEAELLATADPLVVNRGEAYRTVRGTTGAAGESEAAEPEELLRQLSTMCKSAVLTAGSAGAYVFDGFGYHHVAGLEVTTHDTTGAGDEFLGTAVAALASGSDLLSAVERGNDAAAAIVQLARSNRV